jgi:hypothetical protein
VVEAGLADPAAVRLERVERRKQQVASRARGVPTDRGPAVGLDPAGAARPAGRRPDLRVQDGIDGRTFVR